nr:reverse transcriptase domain-containing protein [Tanacetum cinerariifolium]
MDVPPSPSHELDFPADDPPSSDESDMESKEDPQEDLEEEQKKTLKKILRRSLKKTHRNAMSAAQETARVENIRLRRNLEEAWMSNTLLRMGLRRTQKDLHEMTDWAYGFYEGMLRIGVVRDSPTTAIQRMEQELWTLTLKGDDIEAYNNCFHELALICPDLVPTEMKKIKRYIKGFPERIKGNITSSKPTTLQDAINMARELVEQAVQSRVARIRENNKRK